MAKGSVTSCEERLCPLGGGLDNSSKSDLTVQRVLCMGCLNGSLRGGWGAEGIGGGGISRRYSTVSFECAQTLKWTRL